MTCDLGHESRRRVVSGLAALATAAYPARCPALHLLAPNGRPQQVTDDLSSFWATTYAQVRKDLRRRYPKHAWPEDPLTANPLRGLPRRRRGPRD